MGVDTIELLVDSARPTNSHARSSRVLHADGRDPIVMQAIATVTGGRVGIETWTYSSKLITEAIYMEIRRLDREWVVAVASVGRKNDRLQIEVVTG
jgi:hypothetical protein